MMEHTGGKEPD